MTKRMTILGIAVAMAVWGSADVQAAEVIIFANQGAASGIADLAAGFEKATGNKVVTAYGPSMGTAVNPIPIRLDPGEPAVAPVHNTIQG